MSLNWKKTSKCPGKMYLDVSGRYKQNDDHLRIRRTQSPDRANAFQENLTNQHTNERSFKHVPTKHAQKPEIVCKLVDQPPPNLLEMVCLCVFE